MVNRCFRRVIRVTRVIMGIGLTGVALGLSACSSMGGGLGLGLLSSSGGSISMVSTTQATRLDASFRTAVYRYQDENTADLYFSDLTTEQLEAIASGRSRAEVAPEGGQILHIHLFLTPSAGRTPIEFTASNVTLTHIILSGDAVGVYGGGGFLLPSRTFAVEPGRDRFGGDMRNATVRFLGSTEGYSDQIGSASLDGNLNARLDPETASRIGSLMSSLTRRALR
jgi:hypothetical protein